MHIHICMHSHICTHTFMHAGTYILIYILNTKLNTKHQCTQTHITHLLLVIDTHGAVLSMEENCKLFQLNSQNLCKMVLPKNTKTGSTKCNIRLLYILGYIAKPLIQNYELVGKVYKKTLAPFSANFNIKRYWIKNHAQPCWISLKWHTNNTKNDTFLSNHWLTRLILCKVLLWSIHCDQN